MGELEFLRVVREWFESEKNNMAKGNFLQSCLSIISIISLVFSFVFPHFIKLSKEGSEKLNFIFNGLNALFIIILLVIALLTLIEFINNGKNSVLSFVGDLLQKWADNILVTIFMVILPIETILYRLFLGTGLLNLLIGAIQNNTNLLFVSSFVLFAINLIKTVAIGIENNQHKILIKKLNSSQKKEFKSYKEEAKIPIFLIKFLWSLSKKQKKVFCDNCDEIIIKLDSRSGKIIEKQKNINYLRNSNVTVSESVARAIIEK